MLMAEGLGRNLDDTVNMWVIARPLIEDWMVLNRGPDAKLVQGMQQAKETARRAHHVLGQVEIITERATQKRHSGGNSLRHIVFFLLGVLSALLFA